MSSTNLQTIAFDRLGLVMFRVGERGTQQIGRNVDENAGQLAGPSVPSLLRRHLPPVGRELGGQADRFVDNALGNLLVAIRHVAMSRAARARTHVPRTFVVVSTRDVRSSQISA
jgi:hypothetical protein